MGTGRVWVRRLLLLLLELVRNLGHSGGRRDLGRVISGVDRGGVVLLLLVMLLLLELLVARRRGLSGWGVRHALGRTRSRVVDR